jgi:hypothetical protein
VLVVAIHPFFALPEYFSMRLLVIGSQRTNYYELFSGCTVGGVPVEVEHCTWDDLHLASYGDQGGYSCTVCFVLTDPADWFARSCLLDDLKKTLLRTKNEASTLTVFSLGLVAEGTLKLIGVTRCGEFSDVFGFTSTFLVLIVCSALRLGSRKHTDHQQH